MVCGDVDHFRYRKGWELTDFFSDCGTSHKHDGTTRSWWCAETLEATLSEPRPGSNSLPRTFASVVRILMDRSDATPNDPYRALALRALNVTLAREDYEAFYADDGKCYVRRLGTNTILELADPDRPFSAAEQNRRAVLDSYLDRATEDEFTLEVVLPMFRELGYKRITPAGHKDKALEFGKDVWMKFRLPTGQWLYFGIQIKKDKIDAAGASTSNVSTIHNQAMMMLGHEIFDADINKKVLVDHAYIISGGDITKQAREWLGTNLDRDQRRSIIFMDRKDILDLFAVTGAALPVAAQSQSEAAVVDDLDNIIPF